MLKVCTALWQHFNKLIIRSTRLEIIIKIHCIKVRNSKSFIKRLERMFNSKQRIISGTLNKVLQPGKQNISWWQLCLVFSFNSHIKGRRSVSFWFCSWCIFICRLWDFLSLCYSALYSSIYKLRKCDLFPIFLSKINAFL